MKKFFSFVSAILVAGTMCAQTITIDGDNTDWAEVPMVSEPGVAPLAKMLVPQTGITLPENAAFVIMTEGEHELMLADYPVLYVDADKSTTTGGSAWYCPTFGSDYEFTQWVEGVTFAANTTGSVREMCVAKSAFSSVPFTGSLYAFIGFKWGEYMIPTHPVTDSWNWDAADYHPFEVTTYNYVALDGTHTGLTTFATHSALTPSEVLLLSQSDNINDVQLWASWAVELQNPTVYDVTVDMKSDTIASADLYLVEVATNQVVATFVGTDIEKPAGETAYGTWDLSAVPAGKYMLKLKNHVAESNIEFSSVKLLVTPTTALENTTIETTSKKVIENGQIYIIRGNERFNVLGTSVR